jgi:hypothetical protein
MVHVMFPMINVLYFCIITSRSMCTVPSMAVFCRFLLSCFTLTWFRYLLIDFEFVPVATVITGVTFVFIFHIGGLSVLRSRIRVDHICVS